MARHSAQSVLILYSLSSPRYRPSTEDRGCHFLLIIIGTRLKTVNGRMRGKD